MTARRVAPPLVFALLALLALPAAARAGSCDSLARKATTAKGSELVSGYRDLLKCDHNLGESSFDAFMKSSGDAGTLVGVSVAAINAKVYGPVWKMLDKIPDYSARDEVAKGIGAQCASHAEIVPFLEGAYSGVGDIQFGQWGEAFVSCDAPALQSWLEETALHPPARVYDTKYATVVSSLAKRNGGKALPILEKAAIAAQNDGPFDMVLDAMKQAIEPAEIGGVTPPEDKARFEDSLVVIANAVGPEQAAAVADRLFNEGATERAASLLPRVYPDRVQSGGKLLYGAASVEVCEKEAVVHWAPVSEPASRWSIMSDIESPARAFKPRLKCAPGEPWPVATTPEPVKSQAEVSAWVDEIVTQWSGKGLDVKTREEKTIALQ